MSDPIDPEVPSAPLPIITPNMDVWVNTLIGNKLKELCPQLELNTQDQKLFQVCVRDFRNYTVYLQQSHLKVEPEEQNPFEGASYSMVITSQGIFYQSLQTTKEMAEFIDMWIKMWWKKWQQRTKIIFSDKDLPKNVIPPTNGAQPTALSPEEREELLGVTIKKLIQYGEISCTQILGEKLLQKAVEDMRGKELGDKVNLISKLQRQAREISYAHGSLIYIKADQNYFKVREWRNDNFGSNRIA